MESTLKVTITCDQNNQPLAQVCNFPGLDAELYPGQLRQLGVALIQAAFDCEKDARPLPKRVQQEYALTDAETLCELCCNPVLQLYGTMMREAMAFSKSRGEDIFSFLERGKGSRHPQNHNLYEKLPTDTRSANSPTAVIYLCGPENSGKTWTAYGLVRQAESFNRRVCVIDGDEEPVDAEMILDAAWCGRFDEVFVCLPPGLPEVFPVKPFRVIRLGKD